MKSNLYLGKKPQDMNTVTLYKEKITFAFSFGESVYFFVFLGIN